MLSPIRELRRRVLGPPKPGLLMPCDGTHYHRAAHPACVNLQAAATDNWPCDVCRPNMLYAPRRIAVSTNLPQHSSCRDRLVGTAAVPDRHTVPARHTAAPYRHLAAAVATQDRPGGAAAGSARLRQLPPPTPGARCGAPRARFQTNKLTCRAARSRHAVPSCPPTRSASRPAGGLRAGVRPGPERLLMAHPRCRDGSGLRRTPALVGLHCPSTRRCRLLPTPTAASILRSPVQWQQVPGQQVPECTLDWKL